MNPGTTPIDTGTTQEPDGNHWGTSGRSGTPHTLKECGGRNHSPKKFATKQAKNREINRRRKLAGKHRVGAKHTPEMIEHLRAVRLEQLARAEEEARAAQLRIEQHRAAFATHPAVQLYRETMAERGPIIAARRDQALQNAKATIEAADARAFEARHRGRPKSAKRLPNLFIAKSPDALIAAVSEWHGER